MLCALAGNIDEGVLEKIAVLEKDLGKTFLAFQCHDVKPTMLTAAEIDKIQAVENELGVSLVAVEQ
nr:hypothetical protein [uncultured Desulfobulbus sp.]